MREAIGLLFRRTRLGTPLLPLLADAFGSVGVILMYHRVTELPTDPQLLAVTPGHFAEHLEVLRRHYHVLPVPELAGRLAEGRLPRRWVVVTVDDGYADSLHSAKPVLERFDVPASVYVTTGQVGQEREFWWDDLDRLVLQPGTLPTALDLRQDGRSFEWTLGEAANYSAEDYRRHRDWHIERKTDPSARQALYRQLYGFLYSVSSAERDALLAQLWTWAGTTATGRPSHRALTEDEVVRLADGGLVDVGAHSVTHAGLGTLSRAEQRDEIKHSKDRLQGILGRPIASFAYPHGSYDDETLAAVREAGFVIACSSDTSAVRRDADPYRLPRMVVRDWAGEEFDGLVGSWFRLR